MSVAIIGLVGALLGAMTALGASIISARLQAREEQLRRQRDRRQSAYDGALRYVLRAANRRSEILVDADSLKPVVSDDYIAQWFDDVVEAQFWLRSLTTACGERQVARLEGAASLLDDAVASMNAGSTKIDPTGRGTFVVGELRRAVTAIVECAREDLGTLHSERVI